MGRTKFVLRDGILPCGVGFAKFVLVAMLFGLLITDHRPRDPFTLRTALGLFSIWLTLTIGLSVPIGTWVGLVLWCNYERDYHASAKSVLDV